MDVIGTILWPIKWIVELLLVACHWLLSYVGLDPAAGITWVLSIVGLVCVVRAALIPLVARQIRGQRKMLQIAPDLKEIQDRYKGKKDQHSREAMSRETMALYAAAGTNPLTSCLPLMLQAPIFLALFSVLNDAQQGKTGIGLLNEPLALQFGNAQLFGTAALHESFASQWSLMTAGLPFETSVLWIAATLVVVMTASQLITQRQVSSKYLLPENTLNPLFLQQRILAYLLPVVFVVSGVAFPLGVLFYFVTSSVWTLAQHFIVSWNTPQAGGGPHP